MYDIFRKILADRSKRICAGKQSDREYTGEKKIQIEGTAAEGLAE